MLQSESAEQNQYVQFFIAPMRHHQMPHQQKRLIFFSRSQSLRLLVPSRLGILAFHKEMLVLEDPRGARPLSTPPPGGGVYILFLGLVCSWGRVREGEYQT